MFHRVLRSVRGLSASTHRFHFLHFFLVHVLCCHVGFFSAALGRDDRCFAGSSLRHYSVMCLARIHLHRRTQSRNECLHERIIHLLFGHGEGLVCPLTQESRGHVDAQYRSSSSSLLGVFPIRPARSTTSSSSSASSCYVDAQYAVRVHVFLKLAYGVFLKYLKAPDPFRGRGRWPWRWWPGCTFTTYVRCCPFL